MSPKTKNGVTEYPDGLGRQLEQILRKVDQLPVLDPLSADEMLDTMSMDFRVTHLAIPNVDLVSLWDTNPATGLRCQSLLNFFEIR